MDTDTPDTAIGQLKAKAESGETEAQYQLGVCLWEGIGMPADSETALEWVTLAASGGHTPAQSWLGSLHLSNQDEEQARFWFEKAALQGDARAMYYLSLIYVRGNVFGADPLLAFEWLKKLQKTVSPKPCVNLVSCTALGMALRKTSAMPRSGSRKQRSRETRVPRYCLPRPISRAQASPRKKAPPSIGSIK